MKTDDKEKREQAQLRLKEGRSFGLPEKDGQFKTELIEKKGPIWETTRPQGNGTTGRQEGGTTGRQEGGTTGRQEGGGFDYLEYLEGRIKATEGETEQERRRRERQERSRGVINGIADLGRAIANMYYTTQGAPNGYDEKQSLSAGYQARLERAKKERKERAAEHQNYLQQRQKVEDARRDRELKRQATELAWRKQAETERKNAAEDARRDALNESRIKANEALAEYRRALKGKNEAQAEQAKERVFLYQKQQQYLDAKMTREQAEAQARIDLMNAKRDGSFYEYDYDLYGNLVSKRQTYGSGESAPPSQPSQPAKGKGYGNDSK